jgi:sterol desaturase/sphingolipid hydroxylase (fatty acid hydroxylase superfamily)
MLLGQSMDNLWQALQRLLERVLAFWLSADILGTLIGLAVFAVAVVLLEAGLGRDPRRYLSPHFRTDTLYMIFAVSGVYAFLVWRPVLHAFQAGIRHIPFLPLNLLEGLPEAVQFAGFLLVVDFVRYWKHRWMHASGFLWAFHSVHHTQEQLTFMTSYRFHVLDLLLDSAISFAIGLLLGVPASLWLPATLILIWYQSLQHSDLNWSYGALDRVLVSPRFHSVHHSVDPQHYGSNFGMLLSLWDTLFGTAVPNPRRPSAYGVSGLHVEESFLSQLVLPFRILATTRSRPARTGPRGRGAPVS